MLNLWTYWEGPRLPYIQLCLESMARLGGVVFHCITPENRRHFLDGSALHRNFKNLPNPALRADCIRAAILYRYGGYWWDGDTIAIQSPESVIRAHSDAETLYVSWTRPPFRVSNAYIYTIAHSAFSVAWLEGVNRSLADKSHGNIWTALGEGIITPLLQTDAKAAEVDRSLFLPVDVDSSVEDYFSAIPLDEYLSDETVCFGLNHSWFLHWRRQQITISPNGWAISPLLIHQLLHHVRRQLQWNP